MINKRAERQNLINHLLSSVEESMREDDFQRDFFESLTTQFHHKFDLSDRQIECLQKMRDRLDGSD